MFKQVFCAAILASMVSVSVAATAWTLNPASAQNGTTPAGWAASYDQATDVVVVPLATMSPTISADHTGGDGYVLRIGDIGAGGGSFNWAWNTTDAVRSDVELSAWVYVNWETVDTTPLERDYMMIIRLQNDRNPNLSSLATLRQGYWFAISSNATYTGTPAAPANKRAYILKRTMVSSANTHVLIGAVSSTDIPTGWHQMKFTAAGTTLTGYIDGTQVCQGTDTEFGSGYSAIGYYEKNGAAASYPYAAAFDNVSLVVPDPPAAASDWSLFN